MTKNQKIVIFLVSFILGALIPTVSYPLLTKCMSSTNDFWVPFLSITCPIELIAHIGLFVIGFVFSAVFISALTLQLMLMGVLNDSGMVYIELSKTISNIVICIAVLVASVASTIFYWDIINRFFKSRYNKSVKG